MPLKELEVRYATKRSKDYKLAGKRGLETADQAAAAIGC